jgi:hypothetical protein
MGAFNTVIGSYKTPCCSHEQSDWQSKRSYITTPSGHTYFVGPMMENLYIEDLSEAEMHTQCKVCDHFIEYTIKDGELADWKDRGLPIKRQVTSSSRNYGIK